MQASYPNKKPTTHWDTLNLEYPVRKFPDTGLSSETIARRWRSIPETLHNLKEPLQEETNYDRNYNVTKELTQSQTTLHYGAKQAERYRYSKNTPCLENLHIYPPSRQYREISPASFYLESKRKETATVFGYKLYTIISAGWLFSVEISERPPDCDVHGTTEMRSSYVEQSMPSRLVTGKEQFMHPASLTLDPPPIEPFHKKLEPLDTTHEGFEKYLDPYLTSSRLHHRPFTAEQLNRASNTKDIMTYYTYSKIPWVRSPKPSIDKWRFPPTRPKSMYDREKFKEDFREIRTHNKLQWTPSSFRTETRDNYKTVQSRPESQVYDYEDSIRNFYQSSIAKLPTNIQEEHSYNKSTFCSENSMVGSRKPLCSVFDPYVEKNKRLIRKGRYIYIA